MKAMKYEVITVCNDGTTYTDNVNTLKDARALIRSNAFFSNTVRFEVWNKDGLYAVVGRVTGNDRQLVGAWHGKPITIKVF